MKFFSKALAFLTVFLMIFGNGFFSFPVSLAQGNLESPNAKDWTDFSPLGIAGKYIGKYNISGDFTYTVNGDDTFYKNGAGSETYDGLGKPAISYVVIKSASANGNSDGGFFVYEISGGVGTLAGSSAGAVGTYIIRVTYNASGYPTISASASSDSNAISHAYFCVDGYNYGIIKVIKQDAANNASLAGAKFLVSKSETDFTGSNLVATLVTNDEGYAVSGDILCGTYWIKETEAPAGYLNDNSAPRQITVSRSSGVITANTFTFQDRKNEGSLKIVKIDSKTGGPVAGVKFHIAGPGYTGDMTTNAAGEITIDHLTPGDSYTVTEIEAPAGYIVNNTAPVTQAITVGGTAIFNFSDDPAGYIKVIKQDSATGASLAGAEFQVSKSQTDFTGSNLVATLTTDSNGYAISGAIPVGTYWIKETKAPDGYVNDNATAVQITISQSGQVIEANTFTFTDRKNEGSLKIVKVDSKTGEPVQGVKFHIAGPDFTGDRYTDAAGIIQIDHLTAGGSYTVTELEAPADYLLGEKVSPIKTIPVGGIAIFNFSDNPAGYIKVIKKDAASGANLSGAEFEVSTSQTDFTAPSLVATLVTDATGSAVSGALLTGTYWIRESKAPAGYVNDNSTPVSITVVKSKEATLANTFTFSDRKDEGALLVKKISAYDNSPVAGVQFQVSSNGIFEGPTAALITLPNDGKTGINGELLVTGLVSGNYWVREIAPAPGYTIDPTDVRQVLVQVGVTAAVDTAGNPLVFVNTPWQKVRIIKTDAMTGLPLDGAVFGIYTSSDCSEGSRVATLTSGSESTGRALSAELTYRAGTTYYVKEISAPANYIPDPRTEAVTFTAPGTIKEFSFSNLPVTGGLSITKALINGQGDATIFNFTLTGPSYPNGEPFQLTGGHTKDFTALLAGTYTITEILVPGYVLDGFTGSGIQLNNNYYVTVDGTVPTITVTATNYKLGSLTISKAMLDGVTQTPAFAFTVTGPSYPNGTALNIYGGASAALNNLISGTYYIKETVPDGFRQDGFAGGSGTMTQDGYAVVVDGKSAQRDISVTCTNQQLGKLMLTKTDDTGAKKLEGAKFQVSSDSTFPTDPAKTFTLTTASDGTATSGWLVPGTYYVKETEAPSGYHIDDPSVRTILVQPGITASGENTVFKDSLNVGSILVKKFSGYDESRIQGATFQLLNKDPKDSTFSEADNVVDEKVTDSNGEALFDNLPVGNEYWVREAKAASGYIIDPSVVFHFTIESYQQRQYATFYNEPGARVGITKYDDATVIDGNYANATKLGGAVYGIYDSKDLSNKVAEITTSANGETLSAELPFGGEHPSTYYVAEITPPAGYQFSYEVKEVAFTKPGQVISLNFTDVRTVGTLMIKKVDALDKTKTLAGAEFRLYYDEAMTKPVGPAVTTGADGLATFTNLSLNTTYWLAETKAPTDYDKMPDAIDVTQFITFGTATPIVLTITDQYNPPHDIQTGMMDYNVILIGGLALLAGLLLVVFTRKRRGATR